MRSWNAQLAKDRPSTAPTAYRLLGTIMGTAVTDGLILASPCKMKGAGIEHFPECPLATVAEVSALVDEMSERLRALFPLAIWCQLRRGELLGLRCGWAG